MELLTFLDLVVDVRPPIRESIKKANEIEIVEQTYLNVSYKTLSSLPKETVCVYDC